MLTHMEIVKKYSPQINACDEEIARLRKRIAAVERDRQELLMARNGEIASYSQANHVPGVGKMVTAEE